MQPIKEQLHHSKNKTRYKIPIAAFCVITFFLSFFIQHASAKTDDIQLIPNSFSSLAEEASPSVVNIRTVKTIKGGGRVFRHFFRGPFNDDDPMKDFFDRDFEDGNQEEFKQRSLGSGFIIDKQGLIVTNNHVIDNVDEVKVILNNQKEYNAEIIGRDSNTDLALIKIQPEKDLPTVNLGDSDALKVGQWVMAIGNPFGFDHTVTAGIVSAKGRDIGSGPYDDFIQTDASINPGNSGGPLLNMKGEVVGINTAIVASGQGIGFAIPINLAKGIIRQLQEQGEVTRGWLGVTIQDLSEELAQYYGLENKKGILVTDVLPGDPADKAGIKANDIILEINGKKMENSRELMSHIANTEVGKSISIKAFREGKTQNFLVQIGKRDEGQLSQRSPSDELKEDSFGIMVSEITPEMNSRFNINEKQGVMVTRLISGSKGSEAGIQVGDIIKEINHTPIKTIQDFHNVLNSIKKDESIDLYVRRLNRYLILKMKK